MMLDDLYGSDVDAMQSDGRSSGFHLRPPAFATSLPAEYERLKARALANGRFDNVGVDGFRSRVVQRTRNEVHS
jgi:hypothetical protein